jgi:hypothetical protein
VHLFRSRLRFLAEAQPRLKTGEDNRQFLAEVHIPTIFRRSHELQRKDIIGKIINLFSNI